MQHSSLNFLGLPHVPEVLAQIPAGAARYVHFALVFVVANGALPFVVVVYYYFAVKAANVAIVRFRIKFRVLDIVVNKPYNVLDSR